MTHYTVHDFDEDVWDRICLARLHYAWGVQRGDWYKWLRALGYRAGSPLKRDLEIVVDAWLLAHPSWVDHQKRKL